MQRKRKRKGKWREIERKEREKEGRRLREKGRGEGNNGGGWREKVRRKQSATRSVLDSTHFISDHHYTLRGTKSTGLRIQLDCTLSHKNVTQRKPVEVRTTTDSVSIHTIIR